MVKLFDPTDMLVVTLINEPDGAVLARGGAKAKIRLDAYPGVVFDALTERDHQFRGLIENGERFDPSRGTLLSFLYGIARNLVLRRIEKKRPEDLDAADEFAATLGTQAPHEISETLDVAVANAARDAEASGLADPVVLLSPACASFDQYRNFEIRGAAFRDLVTALPGVKPVV